MQLKNILKKENYTKKQREIIDRAGRNLAKYIYLIGGWMWCVLFPLTIIVFSTQCAETECLDALMNIVIKYADWTFFAFYIYSILEIVLMTISVHKEGKKCHAKTQKN